MLRSLAPLIGCGLMMLVCVAVMGLVARKRPTEPAPTSPGDEINVLRAEVARLRRPDDQQRAMGKAPAPAGGDDG